ncbi:hypothetical protein [Acetobacter conturbans]|uniref:Lipoprotein n=1 Tax=Acetobacter conturbans TaxID=1737472 RepID=A0ABX0JXT4_9PROT|nr:hypothetical protein [Acetobacter conturbans]NHN87265.1 hypothetical protein [Acetobacter conturbans]
MVKKIILSVSLCFFLSACVQSHADFLDDRTAIISGRGTAFDDSAGVRHEIYLKAAKLAEKHGYQYFMIIEDHRGISRSYWTQPAQTVSSGSVSAYGNTAYYNGSSVTTPASTTEFHKPIEETTVKFYHEGEIDPATPNLWDARRVLAANKSSE